MNRNDRIFAAVGVLVGCYCIGVAFHNAMLALGIGNLMLALLWTIYCCCSKE